jgi:vacuolar-type H+-ATPase subunit H
MKQIMQDVLKAEERVNAILKQARERASQIRQSAEKEIAEKISEAKCQALEITQTTIEDARTEAERIKEEKLAEAERQQRGLLNDDTGKTDRLVDKICEIVLRTEYARGGE